MLFSEYLMLRVSFSNFFYFKQNQASEDFIPIFVAGLRVGFFYLLLLPPSQLYLTSQVFRTKLY